MELQEKPSLKIKQIHTAGSHMVWKTQQADGSQQNKATFLRPEKTRQAQEDNKT